MKQLLMAAAIATAFTALPTMAASYSSASLSNFQVSLVDLDLIDGNSPFAVFNTLSSGVSLRIPFIGINKGVNENTNLSESINTDVNASVFRESLSNLNIAESTSIFGSGFDNLKLEASGNSLNLFTYFPGFSSNASSSIDYFLSSKTRLIITAQARNYIATEAGTLGENIYLSASSFAAIRANATNSSDGDSASLNTSGINGPALQLSELSILSVMFDNLTDQQIRNVFSASVGAYGTFSYIEPQTDIPSPSAVPVPDALPLMASALGLFGIARRRNKSKAA